MNLIIIKPKITCSLIFAGISFAATSIHGQPVPLGTWLQEGTGSVTGSGSSFEATPTFSRIIDNGDNFDERNAARHRVYQEFEEALDFSTAGQMIVMNFDVIFS